MGIRILIISDTHGKHNLINGSHFTAKNFPEADIFIHAGDFANTGRYSEEFISFNNWLDHIPVIHSNRLLVAGNHDIHLDETHRQSNIKIASKTKAMLTNGRYFQDESIVIDGIKFYLSPWTPEFYGWGFNAKRGDELAKIWEKIPEDVDVLVTHGPPYGILDQIVKSGIQGDSRFNEHLGCEELYKAVRKINPAVHIFGHIHGSRGYVTNGPLGMSTTFINASFLDERYNPHPGPGYFLIELTPSHLGTRKFDVKILES